MSKGPKGRFYPPYGHAQVLRMEVISTTNDENTFLESWEVVGAHALRIVQLFSRHGFTVLEPEDDWRWIYEHSGKVTAIWEKASSQLKTLYSGAPEDVEMIRYDQGIADEVLAVLNSHFPREVNMAQLKHGFTTEPSDEALYLALDALEIQMLISGKSFHTSSQGQKKLIAMASVRLTAEGRKRAERIEPAVQVAHTTHNYYNHGNAAAIGPNASGTFNYQQEWSSLEKQVDLTTLRTELDNAISQLRNTAESKEDFGRLQILAEAKHEVSAGNGAKFFEILSQLGKGALPILGRVGATEVVKLAEHFAQRL